MHSGIYNEYTYYYTGNCHYLASYFVNATRALGLNSNLVHMVSQGINIGEVHLMKANNFNGAGSDPTHPANVPVDEWPWWGYHAWGVCNGVVYDPSSGATNVGTSKDYENIAIAKYKIVGTSNPINNNNTVTEPGLIFLLETPSPWKHYSNVKKESTTW